MFIRIDFIKWSCSYRVYFRDGCGGRVWYFEPLSLTHIKLLRVAVSERFNPYYFRRFAVILSCEYLDVIRTRLYSERVCKLERVENVLMLSMESCFDFFYMMELFKFDDVFVLINERRIVHFVCSSWKKYNY